MNNEDQRAIEEFKKVQPVIDEIEKQLHDLPGHIAWRVLATVRFSLLCQGQYTNDGQLEQLLEQDKRYAIARVKHYFKLMKEKLNDNSPCVQQAL